MKTLSGKNIIAKLVVAALAGVAGNLYAEQTSNVIVKLKSNQHAFKVSAKTDQLTSKKLSSLHQSNALLRQQSMQSFLNEKKLKAEHIYDNVYFGFSAKVTKQQKASLLNDPNVAGVYEDKIYHLYDYDPARTYKHSRVIVDWPQLVPQGPTDSGASGISYRGSNQDIYVIDTGIDTRQNDIKGNLGDSFAAETCYWPTDEKLCPADYSDDHGHGTHVAGTAAAEDNKINALGMAPQATIHAVKVCTKEGSCPTSSILAGLNWAVADMLDKGQPAVANLSLGGPGDDAGECTSDGYVGDNVVAESYCNAAHQGLVVVVAAGNDADDAIGYTPAAYNSTITVSSYTAYDELSGEAVFTNFSNYGSGANSWGDRDSGVITIAAPGRSVLSLNRTHAITHMSGTSMASPAVAGAVALVLEKYPQTLDYSALLNVRQMLADNAIIPTAYTTEPDEDGNEINFPHEEGILNVRFLDN